MYNYKVQSNNNFSMFLHAPVLVRFDGFDRITPLIEKASKFIDDDMTVTFNISDIIFDVEFSYDSEFVVDTYELIDNNMLDGLKGITLKVSRDSIVIVWEFNLYNDTIGEVFIYI